jgi:hypothetical protein
MSNFENYLYQPNQEEPEDFMAFAEGQFEPESDAHFYGFMNSQDHNYTAQLVKEIEENYIFQRSLRGVEYDYDELLRDAAQCIAEIENFVEFVETDPADVADTAEFCANGGKMSREIRNEALMTKLLGGEMVPDEVLYDLVRDPNDVAMAYNAQESGTKYKNFDSANGRNIKPSKDNPPNDTNS